MKSGQEKSGEVAMRGGPLELRFLKEAKYGLAFAGNAAARNALCRRPETPTLFVIYGFRKGAAESFSNLDAGECSNRLEERDGSTTLRFSFERIGGLRLAALVTVAIRKDEPEALFHIDFRNDEPDLVIAMVGFPWISGYAGLGEDPAEDRLALPHREGVLLDDPLKRAKENRLPPRDLYYPGHASMQCMALYDAAGGFLVWADDTQGNVKRFVCEQRAEEDDFLTVGVEHHVPEVPGAGFSPDYSVRLTTFEGDWYDAAEIYRRWAAKQPWCRETLADRNDIPQWYRGPWPVFSIENYSTTGGTSPEHLRHTLAEIPGWVEEYSKAAGLPLISFWTGWERYGAWVSPDLFPPLEGEEAFRQAVEETRRRGHRIMVYFCQALWIRMGEEAEKHFKEAGEPAGIMHRDGRRDSGEEWLGKTTLMCPQTETWQRIIRDAVLQCLAHGIDVVQLDMFPILAPKPCYDPAHGHPPGFGRWYHEAMLRMLERVRTAGRAFQPDLVMSAEHMCELYIPVFDTFTSRDERRNLETPWPRKEITEIPMFLYVYHEYLYTQALEWNMIYLDHFCHDLALQLARGKRLSFFEGYGSMAPKWKPPSAEERKANKGRGLRFLAEAGRVMRSEAAEFILTGRMLRPPTAHVVSEDGARAAIDWNTTEPALGAFSMADGRALLVIANAGEERRNVVIELDREMTRAETAVARNVLDGSETVVALPMGLSVTVPPLGIAAFILRRAR